MPALSMLDVFNALVKETPDDILGCPEGRDIDFKLAPYQLDTHKGKWELAKDIAAFANAGGGLILIGVRGKQSERELVERATELCRVRKDLVDIKQYRDAIATGIVPTPQVLFRWFPEDPTTDGLLMIHIPSQSDRDKPFLLRRVVDMDGKSMTAFAFPRRNEDRTDWVSVEHVQAQLALLDHVGSSIAASTPREITPIEPPSDHLDLLVDQLDANDEPYVAIKLVPSARVDFSNSLFGAHGIVGELQQWRGIRPNGFDLESSSPPVPNGSGVLFGGTRWRGRVGVDGMFELVLPVRSNFLCWAMADGPSGALPINPIVIVESIYDFFRMASALIISRSEATSWTAHVQAMRMKSGNVRMRDRRRDPLDLDSADLATTDDYRPPPFAVTGAAEKDAFEALVRIYGLWALGADDVPLSNADAIDPELIVGPSR